MHTFLKVAEPPQAEPMSTARAVASSPYLAPAAGLAAAGLGGGLIYRSMRTPIKGALSPNARFARVMQGDASGKLGKWLNKQLYGVDKIFYNGRWQQRGGPKKPLNFKGHVFHEDPADARFVRGTVESSSVPKKVLRDFIAMGEDKWKEYKFLSKHVPHTTPVAQSLHDVFNQLGITKIPKDVAGRQAILQKIQAHVKKVHGKYYFKDTAGLQSMGKFPTESHNLSSLYGKYKQSDVPKRIKHIEGLPVGSPEWEKKWYDIREEEAFPGHVLDKMFKNSKKVIVQRAIPVRKTLPFGLNPEMRIHVVGGKVDPSLGTYRYNPISRHLSPRHINEASKWVQKEVIDKLPAEYRNTSYAMDVLPSHGPQPFQLVETNPGGMSGFLHPSVDPISTHRLRRLITGQYSRGAAGTMAAAGALGAGGVAGLGVYGGQKLMPSSNTSQPALPPESLPIS